MKTGVHAPTTHSGPALWTDLARGTSGSAMLQAALELGVVAALAAGEMTPDRLRAKLRLAKRPFVVLTTLLRAIGVVRSEKSGRLSLSPSAQRHLVPSQPLQIGAYLGLLDRSGYSRRVATCLRRNAPIENHPLFVFHRGRRSPMSNVRKARLLTEALAGRARWTAPALAKVINLRRPGLLIDLGCGSGAYAAALLRSYRNLKAVLVDTPAVLEIAREEIARARLANRCEFLAADMFNDPLPTADTILLCNILHDWDVADCRRLVRRCLKALPRGGRLIVHDTFLNDDLGGPLQAALHSSSLFLVTEGRLYSRAEVLAWAGCGTVRARRGLIPTADGYAVLEMTKR